MNEATFDFHGLVGFRYQGDRRGRDFYEAEYGPMRAALPENAPSVSLLWNPLQVIESGTRASHKLLARWTYRVDRQDDHLRIQAAGNGPALPMVHHMLVHHALRLQASVHGGLLLHGSAVVREGRSLIFTGAGGGGKTTTSSLLLHLGRADWRPHADDYVFLRGGLTYAYPSRAHLYSDLLRWVPAIRASLSVGDRLRLQLLGGLRKLTREKVKWPVRASLTQLWPDQPAEAKARLGAIVLLSRADEASPRLIRLEDRMEVADELMAMNFFEARHFLRLIRSAPGTPFPPTWHEDWRARERSLLESALERAPLFRLALPVRGGPGPAMGTRLMAILEPLTRAAS